MGQRKIDHYILTELSARASWHTAATRIIYREFLELWIRPYWSTTNIRNVRTVAVEHWLAQLRRHNKAPLCNSTKAKIRSLHERSIQSCDPLGVVRTRQNPITFVRQSAERLKTPEVLEPSEGERLLSRLQRPYRLMVLAGGNYWTPTK
jgi:hypothetical protein